MQSKKYNRSLHAYISLGSISDEYVKDLIKWIH